MKSTCLVRRVTLAIALLLAIAAQPAPARAQSSCLSPTKSGGYVWRNGSYNNPTVITYGFDASFPQDPIFIPYPPNPSPGNGILYRKDVLDAIPIFQDGLNRSGAYIVFRAAQAGETPRLLFKKSTALPGSCAGALTQMSSSTSGNITFYVNNYCNATTQAPLFNGAPLFGTKITLHELGHTVGLDHVNIYTFEECQAQTPQWTVMLQPCSPGDPEGIMATTVPQCDVNTLRYVTYPTTITGGQCYAERRGARCIQGDPCCPSPIVIDVEGDGFHLSGSDDGVAFDLDADGAAERVPWTARGSREGWLALDRNGNGSIDNGSELFGNYTAQPASGAPNGFLALAVFDTPGQGGDGDGRITSSDAVYASLRLWIDEDHDGRSQPRELHPLDEVGIAALGLDYKESRRADRYGNQFRYRARVDAAPGARSASWAYDVFLNAR